MEGLNDSMVEPEGSSHWPLYVPEMACSVFRPSRRKRAATSTEVDCMVVGVPALLTIVKEDVVERARAEKETGTTLTRIYPLSGQYNIPRDHPGRSQRSADISLRPSSVSWTHGSARGTKGIGWIVIRDDDELRESWIEKGVGPPLRFWRGERTGERAAGSANRERGSTLRTGERL